jgi:hypothetical protein
MRAAVVAAVLAAAGLLASHALADSVPVPTLPTVTVPTPTVQVPVPLPTIPTVTPPVVTAPVETPTAGTPALPSVQSAAGSVAGSTTGGGSESSPSSSQTWISTTGPKRRRSTTVTFTLTHAARIAFVVRQVSPTCRVTGRFTVRAHAGRNKIHIPKRLSRRLLQPGTYRIYARTAAGRLVKKVTLVVLAGGAPSAAELAAARTANVCGTTTRLASAKPATPSGGGLPSASPPVQGENTHAGAVLATSIERAARAIRPAVIALLALAILLLAVASVPPLAAPNSRASYLLASHRAELAGLGAAAFVAVIVAFLLG